MWGVGCVLKDRRSYGVSPRELPGTPALASPASVLYPIRFSARNLPKSCM